MNKNPDKKPDKKRKKTLRERFNEALPDVSKEEWREIIIDTLQDLREPREIALLLGGAVIPGGFIGYAAWRVQKRRDKKAANDNSPPPSKKPNHKKSGPKKGKDNFKP